MNLVQSVRSKRGLSLEQWAEYFKYGNNLYAVPSQTLTGDKEEIANDFAGMVQYAYKNNGVVFACMLARLHLFSEARFQFRQIRSGRPGDLFGTDALSILEKPWPGGTTGDLLTRALQDSDLAGNFFATIKGGQIRRLRPDWVDVLLGSQTDSENPAWQMDAEILSYAYHPGGRRKATPQFIDPENMCHYAPIPDPIARFRGMSWLTPVIREIQADGAATSHKLKFFENGATPNMVVKFDPTVNKQKFDMWVAEIEKNHTGLLNAYKTLYLGGGADTSVVGSDLRQLDFKNTQGGGETRIAAAAGVPPVIVGLSEGLQAATYSNYSQARRRFADGTMRPLWRNMAGSISRLINVPSNSELWYDDRDIPFLKEDQKDAADIQSTQAQSIKALAEAGYEPESVIKAVMSGDFSQLQHSGMFSVQLQPPGVQEEAPEPGRALAQMLAPYLKENHG